ncbi:hypothetical protein EIN_317120 [Entamoeba invadens IP1]|uniref:Uncharacterized protein n=1 Tax=Entamoeba invadens IP1 TaxID=370355 RepID=A0A0A1U2T3_ENTIV|nr:hypothetical protein EIN_317120 [Entamoeba invadens IP1]ELP86973.1 hypothetical protein EIN_317120 [Entamoeba invadens IP1]|eukprot:XP_004253744.1 hypothetical protein EIN_317120 [Entamoeba invadens IP1]
MNKITVHSISNDTATPLGISPEVRQFDESLLDCSQASVSTLLADSEVGEIFKNKPLSRDFDEEDAVFISRSNNPVAHDESFFNTAF